MRLALSFLLLFGGTPFAFAQQTPRIDRIEIIDPGIYQMDTLRRVRDPKLALGSRSEIKNLKLVTPATTVPARLGLDFGYEYRIAGAPDGAKVRLRFVGIYPKKGVRNPRTRIVTHREEIFRTKHIGATSYDGFGFEREWELVPGIWTFQIFHGKRKLSEQSFTVIKP